MFQRSGYHSDDTAYVYNEEIVGIISGLLEVRTDFNIIYCI